MNIHGMGVSLYHGVSGEDFQGAQRPSPLRGYMFSFNRSNATFSNEEISKNTPGRTLIVSKGDIR